MATLLVVLAVVLGPFAAARSTWSPCGLSMLSTITPFGERGRGHRYLATSAWFVAGAVAGGLTLGAAAAGGAALVAGAGLGAHGAVAAAIGAVAAAAGAAVDSGRLGPVLPLIRRQVDDRWLARYRPWVYGAGFGWQIGVGVATYVMTSGVLLVVVLGALSGSPLGALAAGGAFGLGRGLTVFVTARAAGPAHLRALHRRLDRLGEPVRRAVVGAQAAVAAVLLAAATGTAAPPWSAAVALAGAGLLCSVAARRPLARAGS